MDWDWYTMSDISTIEWTDASWNPVTGCTKVSPGCTNCYAERFAERFRGVQGHPYNQGFDLKLWNRRLEIPLRWRNPRRIFVNSMSDLFQRDVPDSFIKSCFKVMEQANWHEFQILTKRPARAATLADQLPWPDNAWFGTSVELQRYTSRIDYLRSIPSKIRFLSCEPLLGPLSLDLEDIHWVIVGGESGPGARPMKEEWVLDIKKQCGNAGIPFFFKQWGGVSKKRNGRILRGKVYDEFPSV